MAPANGEFADTEPNHRPSGQRARTALAYRHAPVDPLGCVGDDSAYKLGTATRGQRDATNMPAAGLTPCPEPGPVIFAE